MHCDLLVSQASFASRNLMHPFFCKSCKPTDVALFFFQLLVNNKIISLDLSVAEVYKKVWCPTNEVR